MSESVAIQKFKEQCIECTFLVQIREMLSMFRYHHKADKKWWDTWTNICLRSDIEIFANVGLKLHHGPPKLKKKLLSKTKSIWISRRPKKILCVNLRSLSIGLSHQKM